MADAPASLNPAQLDAVHHLAGPCLVLAGAGSGKTRVITHKIARLLQAGLKPKQIAAITFTNKAAQEMRERAKGLVGPRAAKELVIATFHSLGVRLLREDGQRLGLKPQFSILDSDDVLGVLRDAGGCSDNALAKRWQWTISLWKNQGLDSDGAAAVAKDADEQVAARVMKLYEERLSAYQAVDFDDLIGLPLKLLRKDAEARAKWQDAFGHVLVDEYQDTNAVQYELLKALVDHPDERRRGLFTAVGDDDQSIYGWRGATIENLKRLPTDWPNLKVIPLEQNYRSTGSILRAANHVIAGNPKLFQKKLWSEFGDGEPVRLIACDGEEHEAERAVGFIQSLRASGGAGADSRGGGGGVKWSDFAILYRANHMARIFEQKLRGAQIPYKVSGGQSFFDRAEIKDLCAWLRLLVNQDDDPAFLRAVTTPKRGIGHTTLGKLGEFAGKWKVSLFEALFAESLPAQLGAKAVGSLHEFGRYVNELEHKARHTSGGEDAKALLLEWLKDIGYEQHLYDGEDSEKLAASRWSNVLDFVDWIAKRCGGQITQDSGNFETERQTVLQVAQTISVIISLAERGDEQDVVTLSTLHAAKGLEWPHVLLAGINEGLLPFKSDAEDMTVERLEEERRLMYVGITRARSTLAVSTLKRRKKGRDTVVGIPSRFIAEMKLDEAPNREDPRERLKKLRAELAAKAAAG
ncbi:UvrD-helicase domain-containing protein [Aquincola sp. S2]|uniref:ATP-dependent DNA helicase Rep n=1 Tax=Pseudaquabacterium terrae TaxID=2732868 RepID=A0ABX2EM01_9BURK|nr:UvrD-helicase domain-containing protein [Aquabacterium terrae]NRF69687.1 UvrD-helicase domain-containing protein [Aquabacterium terrae]